MIIPFPPQSRQQGKSLATERIIAYCIATNHSITIGTSYPNERLKELQEKFPQARFEICGMGVRLCKGSK